ncbi:MAG: pirin-like C-terminal cupin domain-containing protein, partial [Candidatus Magasanikbacteria bacterium]|nr:pirin-like C-terminal cupin domain-containing protein [Candidatus Magasanikbacteria bacterium]
ARIVAGNADKEQGPVKDIFAKPLFIDIALKANKSIDFPVVNGHTVFLYIFEGNLGLATGASVTHSAGDVLLLERTGSTVQVQAGPVGVRFLIVSGKPINETIAWYGPIVMNTKEELETAFSQLKTGDFIVKK